jgi:thioredoxin-like negative regulator of GroEL
LAEIVDENLTKLHKPANVEEALAFAINAIDRGEINHGNAALAWVLQRDPRNQAAWLWMACTISDEQAKRDCYIRAGL